MRAQLSEVEKSLVTVEAQIEETRPTSNTKSHSSQAKNSLGLEVLDLDAVDADEDESWKQDLAASGFGRLQFQQGDTSHAAELSMLSNMVGRQDMQMDFNSFKADNTR